MFNRYITLLTQLHLTFSDGIALNFLKVVNSKVFFRVDFSVDYKIVLFALSDSSLYIVVDGNNTS